ncbi:hypothetical protein PILCRDRAFT_816977 [Piloderma croceum F 1598]|uniref:Protein kinase domain-containing protein n=1 Tax=Piloderma croceum (strain F 1598) TaxID=765440 RepID=A0A0C3G558_PILCF|nr:hypothetical protein PILCRDRAFT_816977 [Piloderma croceum F 1598]
MVMPLSSFQSQQLSHEVPSESFGYQADNLLNASDPGLSLNHDFQPDGIINIESCRFAAYTSYADMYKAVMFFSSQDSPLPVVTKAFRVLPDDHEGKDRLNRMVGRLQTAWSTVGHDHEYISPTWPATVTSAGFVVPAITTPYYHNGNVLQYVRRNPNVDRLGIIFQTACALAYIHSKGVIHGNVCPENICITDDGVVRVTDIGVDTQVRLTNDKYIYSVPSNWMYKASEELEMNTRTTKTDVCSLAATIYSIYTSKPPFVCNPHSFGKGLMHIVERGHEGVFGNFKPVEMKDELWAMVRLCWTIDPSRRPSMSEVKDMLSRIN